MKTVQIKISGLVQGVFFRAKAREQALLYNIKGWVKNTDDGDVEVMASGEEKDVERFIAWCHRGPEKARVVNVSVTPFEKQLFNDFKIIR